MPPQWAFIENTKYYLVQVFLTVYVVSMSQLVWFYCSLNSAIVLLGVKFVSRETYGMQCYTMAVMVDYCALT